MHKRLAAWKAFARKEDMGFQPKARALSAQVDEVLYWLPADTETLIVARGPFEIEKTLPDAEPFDFNKELLVWPTLFVRPVFEGFSPGQFTGMKVALAVEGSRRFRPPRGFGLMPFEGCQIVIFHEQSRASLKKEVQSLMDKAPRTVDLAGRRVAVYEGKCENETWTIHYTQPGPEVLLCATSESYLKEVLSRMETRPPTRAFPENLPEWKHVDPASRFWAIRHFREEHAENDPSSPFCPEEYRFVPSDGQAVGFTFSHPLRETKDVSVRYLTEAEDVVGIARSLPYKTFHPDIRQVEPNAVEITMSAQQEEGADKFSWPDFLFFLLASLGHATYV